MYSNHGSSSSTPTASSATSHVQKPVPNSKYELHHSVSELFRILNVEEHKEMSKEAVAERFERNIGHQSKKPFSLFFSRLSDNHNFLEKYHPLKCQNLNEVDPFVRFLVRVREDKSMNNFFNNFQDVPRSRSSRLTNGGSAVRCPSQPPATYRKSASTSKIMRPTSASSAFLAMAAQQDLAISQKTPLRPANSAVPNLGTPISIDYSMTNNQNDSVRTVESYKCAGSNVNHQSISRKVPVYVSRDFHPCDWPKENDCFGTLGTHSVQEQEQLLLRDLLFMLIGIEGQFIRLTKSNDSTRYKLFLDPSADHFLAVTTNRILKICYHYSAIVTFVESRVYGLVNQALVAFIHQHLYDYNMTVCQMEEMLMKNDLFLQKMFFILLPYFSTFCLLKEICAKLYKNKSVGGAVLTLLHEKTKSIQGMDNNALELCLNMTKSAAIPYFDILKTWIYYGEIGDPRKEFFIEDTHNNHTILSTPAPGAVQSNTPGNHNEDIESDDEYDDDFGKFNDKYWDNRYRINPSKTPCFLKKHEQIIYKTGKYISIINKVKQLFLKSSKVIPIPQSLNPVANTMISATTVHTETFKAPPSTTGGSSSFVFLNNYQTPLSTNHNQNNLLTIADNHSLASMASSSSSNTSHSTGGPTPSAAIFTPKPEEIYYSFDETTYLSPIMSAYDEASSQLLHILIHESQLVETFNAVKHYMLLSMGDFIVHFLKFASKDLCKRTDSVVQHRLDSMMGMALGISVCHSDRQYLKDDPHVEFIGKSLLKQIYQIMKPFNDDSGGPQFLPNDPSPSSSYLLRCDDDAADEDEDDDVNLNRSIINSVIEAGCREVSNEIDSKVRITKYVGGPKNNEPITKSKNEQRKLFCYESLTLKFDVPFPLSLIFTQKSILCYELLFRYVFLCRYAEMELEETWKDNILTVQLKRCDTQSLLTQLTNQQPEPEENTNTAKLMAKTFKSIHKKAFALRYKMIAFVRNFHYFYAFEVIDPFFAQFIGQITKRGSSLDSVIECHEKFLEHCFSSCFLTSIEITTIIIKIFTLCIELSHVLRDSIDVDDQSSMMESSCFFGFDQPRSKDLPDAEIHEKLDRMYFSRRRFSGNATHHNATISKRPTCTIMEIVEKANNEFDALISQLLKKIYSDNCEYHMMYPFVARLDYNDFYRSQMIE